jgi:hypothetical protein
LSPDGEEQPFFDQEFESEKWYGCDSEYSIRFLLVLSDKLAALAGLAAKFCHPKLRRYLTGIWGVDLF